MAIFTHTRTPPYSHEHLASFSRFVFALELSPLLYINGKKDEITFPSTIFYHLKRIMNK